MSLRVLLCLCLCLFCPSLALAELPKQVELDFAVLSGTIVMPMNDEYIVDLDARDNLAVGDILALVGPGTKVYHPETREVLGTVYTPTGYLKVTRINSGYSYARPLSAEVQPKNGDLVRRFEQAPALIQDSREDGGQLASQLRMDLPQFRWLKDGDSESPLLTFVLKGNDVAVKTVDGNLLHSYAVQENQQLKPPPTPVRQPFGAQRVKQDQNLLQQAADTLMTTLNLKDKNEFISGEVGLIRQGSAAQRGVWLGPNLNGSPVGISVADLDGDGAMETATALENTLLIARISQGQYTEVAEVKIPARLRLLSLDAADLNNNGRAELYVTAVDGYHMASFVVEYGEGADYRIVMDNLGWYLRVVDLPGQQRALAGQVMGSDAKSFMGKPFFLRPEGDRLVKGESIELPGLVNLYSFLTFTDQQNTLYYAYVNQNDYLAVMNAAGKELWVSSEYFGGSEACFDNRQGNNGDMVIPTCIRPRLLMTPDREIVVVQNEGQRLMERYRKFMESRLVAVVWNGFALVESWRTAGQKGYLGDFAIADGDNDGKVELVMAVKFKHKGIIDDARAAVVIYEMD